MHPLPRLALLLATLLVGAACSQPADEAEQWQFSGPTMGTAYSVKVVPGEQPGAAGAEAVAAMIEARLERVNALMSTWREDSQITALNRAPAGEAFTVDPELFDLLVEAREIGQLSDGAFDITVGPLVNAWGFGPAGPAESPPSSATLAALDRSVGWDKLHLDPATGSVTKRAEGLVLDLSAIAKGYGVDQVADGLTELGLTNYMVEVGGELRLSGHNRQGRPWRIGIDRPDSAGHAPQRVLELSDCALATSGDYRNFYMSDGRRISHTIDPRTARPIEHGLASVSVITPRCARADALATALNVLGAEAALELAAREDLAVYVILRAPDGAFVERASPAFLERFGPLD